jgi:hypothetical protein
MELASAWTRRAPSYRDRSQAHRPIYRPSVHVAAVLGYEYDASFFAGRAADRFSKYCGKAVKVADAATARLNARELAQRRVEAS